MFLTARNQQTSNFDKRREFFDKVASKDFTLACDVWMVLSLGHEITPQARANIQRAVVVANAA